MVTSKRIQLRGGDDYGCSYVDTVYEVESVVFEFKECALDAARKFLEAHPKTVESVRITCCNHEIDANFSPDHIEVMVVVRNGVTGLTGLVGVDGVKFFFDFIMEDIYYVGCPLC